MSVKRLKRKRCPLCGQEWGISAWTPNPHLADGLWHWCNACLFTYKTAMRESKDSLERAKLRRQYRNAYHRAYNKAVAGRERNIRKAVRGRRMGRKVLQAVLSKKLTVEVLRRESVYAEFMRLLPQLRKTPTWTLFEDQILARYEKEAEDMLEPSPTEKVRVYRFLPEEVYPELALATFNCSVAVGNRIASQPTRPATWEDDAKESLVRLSQAIAEVGYYVIPEA